MSLPIEVLKEVCFGNGLRVDGGHSVMDAAAVGLSG